MKSIVLTVVAIASLGLLLLESPVTRSYTLYPEDLAVTYTIDDLTGQLAYQETGALAEGVLCPGSWIDVNRTSSPTLQQGHTYRVALSLRLGRYLIEETQNLILHRVERYCAVPPSIVPLPSDADCRRRSATAWEPNVPFSSTQPVGEGWHDQPGPGPQTALGARQSVPSDQDLTYNRMRLNFTSATPPASIPFTGRMHFKETVTGHDMYWMDSLGGRCMPTAVADVNPTRDGYGSPDGCCQYAPTRHEVYFEAANTAFGARPFGTWRFDLQVCNNGCA